MIRSKGDEELEKWLNRATDPSQPQENADAILKFTQQVSKELEGPQIALRLLAHKIQSPMEREALYALSVTECCVRNCGAVFHQELGKFRFLNEVIKVISPKYLGSSSSEAVRKRCIELVYSWSKCLYTEPKIKEAYEVLKKQGLVTKDPTYIDQSLIVNPYLSTKQEVDSSMFQDPKTSSELNRLLKSKKPEDLIAANRLIKGIVKQDSERMEKLSLKLSEMETIKNNIQLLSEMLNHYQPNETGINDIEIIQVLYKNLESARLKLFKFASETDDKDDAQSMSEILKINDAAGDILRRCKETIGADKLSDEGRSSSTSQVPQSPAAATPSLISYLDNDPFDPLNRYEPLSALTADHSNSSLLDLPPSYDLVLQEKSTEVTSVTNTVSATRVNTITSAPAPVNNYSNVSSLFTSNPSPSLTPTSSNKSPQPSSTLISKPDLLSNKNKISSGSALETTKPGVSSNAFQDLDILGKQMLAKARVSPVKQLPVSASASSSADSTLLDLTSMTNMPQLPVPNNTAPNTEFNFKSIPVLTLSSLTPHAEYSPQPILQAMPSPSDPKAVITATLHFTSNKPVENVTVLLCVLSSSLPKACSNVKLTVQCKKDPKCVYQQEATGNSFAEASPFIPSTPISSCILVHEPEGRSLTFLLSYSYDGQDKTVKSLGITLPDDL